MLSLDNAGWICTPIMIAYHPALLLLTTLTGLGVIPSAEVRGLIAQTYVPVSAQTLSLQPEPGPPVVDDLTAGGFRDRGPISQSPDPPRGRSLNKESSVASTSVPRLLAQNPGNPASPTQPDPRGRFNRQDLIWILFLGFGTLAFAGIFVGAFYLLTRSSGPDEETDAEAISENSSEVFKHPPDEFSVRDSQPELDPPVVQKPDLSENSPEPPHHGNGYTEMAGESAPKLPPSAAVPPSPPEAGEGLIQSEPPHLAKIDAIETLIEDLQSRVPTQRRKAIWELGQKGDSRAVQPLVNLLMDSDSRQRSLILASLAEIGNRTLQPMNRALVLSLQDSNPEVRKNAIRDLTRIYDLVSQTSQLLRHASEDSDPEVREAAQWALSQLNRLRPSPPSDSRSSLQNWPPSPETYPEDIP
jgi:hypothetical protein